MSKISPNIDLIRLKSEGEPCYFTLQTNAVLSEEDIQKLTALGGELKYDNGMTALIVLPPDKLEEFVQIETVISAR